MNRLGNRLGWAALSLLGAGALAYVALRRGESINAVWVVAAAVCVYLIAYRHQGDGARPGPPDPRL
jgi:hypothetical protein